MPVQFFLGSAETRQHIDLHVDSYTGVAVTASIAPSPPFINQPANLAVLVEQRSVDAQGIVNGTGVDGVTVQLLGTGYSLDTPAVTVTDANGIARWRVRCGTFGDPGLSVSVGDAGSYPITVPPCAGGATTLDTGSTTSTTLNRRTPTTRRGG
jgi:hypothetical protein